MKIKSAPKPTSDQPGFVAPLASYVAVFEQWMQRSARCRNSVEAEDIRQEIRIALWESKDVPATRDEARLIFLRLASRFESRSRRQMYRQGALVEQPEELAEAIERDALRSLALFRALEKLSDEERWLVKECKIEERSHADVARQLGVSDHTVGNRLWRAMTKLIAILKDEEKRLEKDKKSLGVIAPLAFDFTEAQRAAFQAIWTAEGRIPTFGGGPPEPPDGLRALPPTAPMATGPLASIAAGGFVSASLVIAGLLLLAAVPIAVLALQFLGNAETAQTAIKGLHIPKVAMIDDVDPVVPMYQAPMQEASASSPVESPPTSSESSASSRSKVPSSQKQNVSPPIDRAAIERAYRRPPHFLPSP